MQTPDTYRLWIEADQLLRQGNEAAAYAMLKETAAFGNIGAMTKLAHLARSEKREAESHEWMDKAEKALRPGDIDGRKDLADAYGQALGRGNYSDLKQRERALLEEVAESGDISVQIELGQHFSRDLVLLKDESLRSRAKERRDYWINRAMDGGAYWAFFMHASVLFEEKKPVPPEVIKVLEELQSSQSLWVTDQKNLDVLLRAIARRANRKPKS